MLVTPQARRHRRKQRRPALSPHCARVALDTLALEAGLLEVCVVRENDSLRGGYGCEGPGERVLDLCFSVAVTIATSGLLRCNEAIARGRAGRMTTRTVKTGLRAFDAARALGEMRSMIEAREQRAPAREHQHRERHTDEENSARHCVPSCPVLQSTTTLAMAWVSKTEKGVVIAVPESTPRTWRHGAHSTLATPVSERHWPRTG